MLDDNASYAALESGDLSLLSQVRSMRWGRSGWAGLNGGDGSGFFEDGFTTADAAVDLSSEVGTVLQCVRQRDIESTEQCLTTASALDVNLALETLSGIGAVSVQRTGPTSHGE